MCICACVYVSGRSLKSIDSKSPQVFRTCLSIQTDLNKSLHKYIDEIVDDG